MRCLSLLHSVSTLDDPAWNKEDVRATADVLTILDRVSSNLEQVPILAGINDQDTPEGDILEGDIFARTARFFRSLRPVWAAKLGQQGGAADFAAIDPQTAGADMNLTAFDLDWLNDDWVMNYPMVINT